MPELSARILAETKLVKQGINRFHLLRLRVGYKKLLVAYTRATLIISVQQDSSPEQICLHFEIHPEWKQKCLRPNERWNVYCKRDG